LQSFSQSDNTSNSKSKKKYNALEIMTNPKILFFIFIMLLTSACTSDKFHEKDFEKFVSKSDTVLFDGDNLHPTYAYLEKGQLKGVEYIAHPECGHYIRKYFFNHKEEIFKVIVHKVNISDNCPETFDSVYVLYPLRKTAKMYSNSNDGEKLVYRNEIEKSLVDIKKFKKELKEWNYHQQP